MGRRRLVETLAVVVLLVACSPSPPPPSGAAPASPAAITSASPAPGGSGTTAPSHGPDTGNAASLAQVVPADWFTSKPSPINLALKPADDAAVASRIGPDGGRVAATGPDGTTYTLDVPAGALPMELEITLTPLSDFSGLPFDAPPEHRVGVTMRPNGLEFVRPATLTIHPSAAPPPGSVATLGYRAAGHDAGAVPADDANGDLRVTVEHFSGFVAVWPVKEAEWRSLARQEQELQEWAYASEITTALAWRRGMIIAGADPATMFSDRQIAKSFLPEYIDRVLKPRLQMAGFGCAEAQAAINAWFGYWHALVLLGLGGDPEFNLTIGGETYTAAEQLPEDIIDNAALKCMEEDYHHCVANGDFFVLHRRLFTLIRYVELLGREFDPQWVTDFISYAKRCGQWKLDAKTTFDDGTPNLPPGSQACCPANGGATRRFELAWKPGSGSGLDQIWTAKIEAKADLERMRIEFEGNLCHVSHTYPKSVEQAAAKIASLVFEYPDDPATPGWAASGYPVGLTVSLELGKATSHVTYKCPIPRAQAISLDYPFDHGQVYRITAGVIEPDKKEPELYPLALSEGWEFTSLSPFKAHFHKDMEAVTPLLTQKAGLDLLLTHTPH